MPKLIQTVAALFRSEPVEDPPLETQEIYDQIAGLTSEQLGKSPHEAIQMLRSGELDGTVVEVQLKARLFLLGDEAEQYMLRPSRPAEITRSVPPATP